MAKKVHYSLEDDLTGGPADVTVRFALDSTGYEIDLSKANADKLRDLLAPYVANGRKITGRRGGGRRAAGSQNLTEIREWLRGKGHKVSDRGRIPGPLLDEYNKAHSA